MLYCQGYTVSFQEVPDEVSLVFLVADCPHRCPGCHSPQLQKPEGFDLERQLLDLIAQYADAITCVCFMGEGQDTLTLIKCSAIAQAAGFKTCVYSGWPDADERYSGWFDYIKSGPYIAKLGGLDNPATNQKMWRLTNANEEQSWPQYEDITHKFRKESSSVVV